MRNVARDRTTPMHAEPVRNFMAETIKYAFTVGSTRPVMPEGVTAVRMHRIGPSETRVQASMDDGTTRTFTIALRENK